MTIRITDSYFAANLARKEDEFIRSGDFYEKTIDPLDKWIELFCKELTIIITTILLVFQNHEIQNYPEQDGQL